ncbi:hypothetical protein [Sphingomonas sp. 28-63-12]|uniref:hypothetical protein n=1 Tax=Sphingomonas sp. 28-63-12 TaxID=1970434 RepID=UPI0035A88D72
MPCSRIRSSTLDISFEVRGGLFVRQVHHWAALMFAAAIMVPHDRPARRSPQGRSGAAQDSPAHRPGTSATLAWPRQDSGQAGARPGQNLPPSRIPIVRGVVTTT